MSSETAYLFVEQHNREHYEPVDDCLLCAHRKKNVRHALYQGAKQALEDGDLCEALACMLELLNPATQ